MRSRGSGVFGASWSCYARRRFLCEAVQANHTQRQPVVPEQDPADGWAEEADQAL